MFCVQCEQTISSPAGKGCSFSQGMCGKTANVSDLQDLLVYALQGTSFYAEKAREFGIVDRAIDTFVPQAFFATLTNVNFEAERITGYARQAQAYRQQLRQSYEAACQAAGVAAVAPSAAAAFTLAADATGLLTQAPIAAVNRGKGVVILFKRRGAAGDQVAAKATGLFVNNGLVATQSQHTCRFATGNAATQHQHLFAVQRGHKAG